MIKLYRKYEEIVNYLIFGGLTTFVSIGSYYIWGLVFNLRNDFLFVIANVLSWILAVTFAYITNKKYVFKSDSRKIIEFCKFVCSRILTLLMEVLGMYLLVKVIKIDNMIAKVLMQLVVIVTNYVISKVLVFKR